MKLKRLPFKKKAPVKTNYNVITVLDPTASASEAYRRIKIGIDFANVDKKPQVIQITSAVQGEGKTTVTLNLAATYCELGKKVIVVECDFRRPKIHRAFHIENKNGIADVLTGNMTLEDAIKHSEELPFDILNRGSKVTNPTIFLESKELGNLIEKLRGMYDYVLLDCPPILAVSDALTISKYADGAVFIVSQKTSDKSVSITAMKELKANSVNIYGCVFTQISRKNSDYYGKKYHYYYQSNYGNEK